MPATVPVAQHDGRIAVASKPSRTAITVRAHVALDLSSISWLPMRPFILAFAFTLSGSAWSLDCGKMIETHGFKAEAQVTCNFGQRENPGLIEARACAGRQDPALNVRLIQRGQAVFQATARMMGKAAACQDVLRSFGGVLYPLR